ncbi:MAG TPA: ABC transporter permease [Chloroflexota bacterium]|jgi:peptide/nickel transport system permease protein
MLTFIVRRVVLAVPTLIGISVVSFIIMQLPPGDFLSSYAATLAQQGEGIAAEQLEQLRIDYGLGEPLFIQYWKWISAIVFHGDFGLSLNWRVPVASLLWDRLGWTVGLTSLTIAISYMIAIPIGVYSATHQYSKFDNFFSSLGFLGLGIPDFTVALAILWFAYAFFGADLAGLFSSEFRELPWSLSKLGNLLQHLWLPILVLAWHELASLQRVMRANLLDELHKPYVLSARAGGLSEQRVIWEYPVRVALNPFVSAIGFVLPELISRATIVSIVLSLPMTGPLYINALQSQDMYLAGALMLLISALTIVGILLSDIWLAWLDPRIRYGR